MWKSIGPKFDTWAESPCFYISEAPLAKTRGIFGEAKRNCAVAHHPPSPRLRRGRLSVSPRGKLRGIRAPVLRSSLLRRMERRVKFPPSPRQMMSFISGLTIGTFCYVFVSDDTPCFSRLLCLSLDTQNFLVDRLSR